MFYNLFYGKCFIHEESEELYLVEVEKNAQRFIVCKTIMEDGAMLNQRFFNTYEEALEFYNSHKKGIVRK